MREKIQNVSASAALMAITFGVCGPLQLFITNKSEFWFSIGDILGICFFCGAVIFAVVTGIGVLLPQKIQNFYSSVVLGIALALYIQGNYVATDYGVLDGREINWDNYRTTAVLNTLLWIACIAIPVALEALKPTIAKRLIPLFATCITIMQILTVGMLAVSTDLKSNQSAGYMTDKGINEISSNENAIVFVLDTFDQEYFREIYKNEPEFLTPLDGFTYFDNVTGMYSSTKGAMPYILTGQIYKNEQPYNEYVDQSYHNTSYYDDLKEAGYDIGIYTTASYVSPSVASEFSNYADGQMRISSYPGFTKTLYKFVSFRYFPHLMKKSVWFYSGEFDQWKQADNQNVNAVGTIDNYQYYSALKEQGLTLTDGKIYKLIHLYGVHSPYNLDENLESITDGSGTYYGAAKAVLKIVFEYIDQLKKLGVYDNTTLVIMADHGQVGGVPTAPLLLIKGKNQSGELQQNNAPICQGDYQATVMTELGLNDGEKYGKSAFDVQEGDDRQRHFFFYSWDNTWSDEYLPTLKEYEIDPTNNELSSYHAVNYAVEPYELGTVLSFAGTDRVQKYCVEGFSVPEEKLTWTDTKRAIMEFQLTEIPDEDISVCVDVLGAFNGEQRVTIKVRNTIVYDSSLKEAESIEFAIPKNLVEDGNLRLVFELPDAVSPSDLGTGTDIRQLGIALESIVLKEANTANSL